jgi:DNA repair exonuclease SbcCD ATPase subunit
MKLQLSPAEINETTATEAQVISTNTTTKSEIYAGDSNANEQSELKTMLASVLTQSDKLNKLENKLEALQSKLETSDRELKERYENLQNKLDKLESSHRELKESNDQLQKDIEIKLENLQENMKTYLETETEKLIQRFDLASENQVVEVSNQEKIDVILRRQGECVEQMQLQANQVSVLDLELKSDVGTVDPLENRQIDLTDESKIVELSNPEQTDVILGRQGEQAEQILVEENKVDNSDSNSVVTKENIRECNDASFISHIPYVEEESVDSPSMLKASTKTEIVGVKESRANCFASYIIVSNTLNDSNRVLLSIKDSFRPRHSSSG